MGYTNNNSAHTWEYKKIMKKAISLNDRSSNGLFFLRDKDYWDSKFIQFAQQKLKGTKKKFGPFVWQDRMAPLIPFHHPSHPFYHFRYSIQQGVEK